MKGVTQSITACPVRNDGHNAAGEPGDCMRAAVSSLTGVAATDVPHFAVYLDWWGTLRRWARGHGYDFMCIPTSPVPDDWQPWWEAYTPGMLMLGSGPSPRGPFWHMAVVDHSLQVVHDPHPSRAGLLSVEEVFVRVSPYTPAPTQMELTA